jgi:hypothetical protein
MAAVRQRKEEYSRDFLKPARLNAVRTGWMYDV